MTKLMVAGSTRWFPRSNKMDDERVMYRGP